MFNENDVVSRILKGDLPAFELLVKQYEQLVFYVVDRLINEKEDIADISQEVFIKVYKHLGKFKFQSKLSTWIAQIAYRTAMNYLRDHKKGNISLHEKDLDELYFTNDSPEQLLTKKDVAHYLHRLIAQMPAPYRTVVTLYHLNEFSYQEIAQITGMPEGTVKNYLFRARKLLKDRLQKHLYHG